MKVFTEPNGKFALEIPTEWQYQNLLFNYEEISPFSFELYENSVGAFQISCYSFTEKPNRSNLEIQEADTNNLKFAVNRMDGGGFNVHLWYALVAEHTFMIKYIYDTNKENDPLVADELLKVEKALSTLELISESKRQLAIDTDRYEKFIAALAASTDLRNRASENGSLIELLIIIANQIDAYLRIALVLNRQLVDRTDDIEIRLLFQGENDPPVMERKIYKQALDAGIITADTFDKLESLYKERNKVVHRYIITDFRTKFLFDIVHEYEKVCEAVRLDLKRIEDTQYIEKIGNHGKSRNPSDEPSTHNVNMLYSWVNDKHLINELYREIKDHNDHT